MNEKEYKEEIEDLKNIIDCILDIIEMQQIVTTTVLPILPQEIRKQIRDEVMDRFGYAPESLMS